MARFVAVLLLCVALGALLFAASSVRSAYVWVAHTSDVRVELAGGLTLAHEATTDAASCDALHERARSFARLTVDNAVQRARVPVVEDLVAKTCGGDRETARALTSVLGDADAEEVRLLHARRTTLEQSALWALGVFALAMATAIGVAIAANRGRRETARALEESEARFRHLAESATDLIRVHAPDGKCLWVTPSCERLLGFTEAEILAMPAITGLVHPDEVDMIRSFVANLTMKTQTAITHRLRQKSGEYRWFDTQAHAVVENGKMTRMYTTSRDVNERVVAEQKLAEMSVTDELTQLHNRRGFKILAKQQQSLATRQKCPLVLVYADLDGLKKINDGLGHAKGDAAIRDFAAVMKSSFRACDVVARIGGDEFVALAFDVADGAPLEARLQAGLRAFNERTDQPYKLAASLGWVVIEVDATQSIDEHLAKADATMYEQKRARREQRHS